MKEVKVFVVDVYNYEFDESPLEWDDEKFVSEAEIQGSVFSLKGFANAVNSDGLYLNNSFIRFVELC